MKQKKVFTKPQKTGVKLFPQNPSVIFTKTVFNKNSPKRVCENTVKITIQTFTITFIHLRVWQLKNRI
jgi:hypothetical protein